MSAIEIAVPDFGMREKKFGIYTTGIFLCVILTLVPFAAVIYDRFSHAQTLAIIFVSAMAQLFVQVLCFLRLNYTTEQAKMNVMSLIFAMVVLTVIVGGSLWIMWTLNYRMMH